MHDDQPRARVRDPETRGRDHDQIDRLTDELLPDLIERLASSGLGELEVREDDWRIRLRLPAADAARRPASRSGADRGERQAPARGASAASTADARTDAGSDGRPDSRPERRPEGADHRGNGTGPGASPALAPHRVIAISPAVGIFQARPDLRTGARVRQGDRIGSVDLLGVPQDVVAPEDGVVVDTLAENGEGVEYGQDLVVIEPARGHRLDSQPADAAAVSES